MTDVDIAFSKALSGYKTKEVDDCIEKLLAEINRQKSENKELQQKLKMASDYAQELELNSTKLKEQAQALLSETAGYQSREAERFTAFENTMAAAHQTAGLIKQEALREAEKINKNAKKCMEEASRAVDEANQKADYIVSTARAQADEINENIIREILSAKHAFSQIKARGEEYKQFLLGEIGQIEAKADNLEQLITLSDRDDAAIVIDDE